ncbi:unnamed protein product [Ectocarpus sp. CCAP 1310/34]|nr:unnamed protein product [Ectocarpus sp. CCAP 1310/34]
MATRGELDPVEGGEEDVDDAQVEVELHARGGDTATGFSPLEDLETLGSRSSAAIAHSGVVGGMLGGRGGGGGRHARLETESERLARRSQRMLFWALSAVAGLLAILVGLVAVAVREGIYVGDGGGGRQTYDEQQQQEGSVAGDGSGGREVSRIAFGSCTQVEGHPGRSGAAYLDPSHHSRGTGRLDLDRGYGVPRQPGKLTVNCDRLPEDPDCVCRDTYMRVEPWCAAGDPDHGLRKFQTMIRNPEYNQFLDFMCPAARGLAMTPPPGTDSAICPRTILGTWDDHDYGWNDGDSRNEQKWLFKNMFLDAIGEDRNSPRRNAHQGMWHKHVLNSGTDREIEVFLLDERYDRDTKPCYLRRSYCEKILEDMDAGGNTTSYTVWCVDFLRGGHGGNGSCCQHDEKIFFGWCLEPSSRDSPFWEEACDSSSREFGKRWLVFDEGTGDLRHPDGTEEVDSQDSPFCEVLGREQRAWLQRELDQSTASLRLIVSGSVVLGRPGNNSHICEDGEPCQCSNDDWDCYRPAQQNLLSQVSKAPGCSVILTGDYHYGDIKALLPGGETPYWEWYSSEGNDFPVYQVMASGMTTSTAERNRSCDTFYLDDVGLRTHPECDLVQDPNFGLLQVGFEDGTEGFSSLEMQIRDWNGTVRVSASLSPDMCNPRQTSTT